MNWESWPAFWSMGGAGPFVWGSYGVTAAVLALEIVLLRARRANSVRRLQRIRATSTPSAARPLSEIPT